MHPVTFAAFQDELEKIALVLPPSMTPPPATDPAAAQASNAPPPPGPAPSQQQAAKIPPPSGPDEAMEMLQNLARPESRQFFQELRNEGTVKNYNEFAALLKQQADAQPKPQVAPGAMGQPGQPGAQGQQPGQPGQPAQPDPNKPIIPASGQGAAPGEEEAVPKLGSATFRRLR